MTSRKNLRALVLALVGISAILAAFAGPVFAGRSGGVLTPDVLEALHRLQYGEYEKFGDYAGAAKARDAMLLFKNNDEINRARLNGWIGDNQYQTAQRQYAVDSERYARRAVVEVIGDESHFGPQASKKPGSKIFMPGTDSDYIIKNVTSVEQVERMQASYNRQIDADLKKNGVLDEPGANWHNKLDVDFMAHPEKISQAEFEKVAKANNDAYKRRAAAEYEALSRTPDGAKVGPDHVVAYAEEMKDFAMKKRGLLDAAKSDPHFFSDSAHRADIHRKMAQQQKYIERIESLTDTVRKQNGLRPIDRNPNIDPYQAVKTPNGDIVYRRGVPLDKDGFVLLDKDVRRPRESGSAAARGAVRSPDNLLKIQAGDAVAKNSLNRGLVELSETYAELWKKDFWFRREAARDIATIAADLPPSEKGVLLESIRRIAADRTPPAGADPKVAQKMAEQMANDLVADVAREMRETSKPVGESLKKDLAKRVETYAELWKTDNAFRRSAPRLIGKIAAPLSAPERALLLDKIRLIAADRELPRGANPEVARQMAAQLADDFASEVAREMRKASPPKAPDPAFRGAVRSAFDSALAQARRPRGVVEGLNEQIAGRLRPLDDALKAKLGITDPTELKNATRQQLNQAGERFLHTAGQAFEAGMAGWMAGEATWNAAEIIRHTANGMDSSVPDDIANAHFDAAEEIAHEMIATGTLGAGFGMVMSSMPVLGGMALVALAAYEVNEAAVYVTDHQEEISDSWTRFTNWAGLSEAEKTGNTTDREFARRWFDSIMRGIDSGQIQLREGVAFGDLGTAFVNGGGPTDDPFAAMAAVRGLLQSNRFVGPVRERPRVPGAPPPGPPLGPGTTAPPPVVATVPQGSRGPCPDGSWPIPTTGGPAYSTDGPLKGDVMADFSPKPLNCPPSKQAAPPSDKKWYGDVNERLEGFCDEKARRVKQAKDKLAEFKQAKGARADVVVLKAASDAVAVVQADYDKACGPIRVPPPAMDAAPAGICVSEAASVQQANDSLGALLRTQGAKPSAAALKTATDARQKANDEFDECLRNAAGEKPQPEPPVKPSEAARAAAATAQPRQAAPASGTTAAPTAKEDVAELLASVEKSLETEDRQAAPADRSAATEGHIAAPGAKESHVAKQEALKLLDEVEKGLVADKDKGLARKEDEAQAPEKSHPAAVAEPICRIPKASFKHRQIARIVMFASSGHQCGGAFTIGAVALASPPSNGVVTVKGGQYAYQSALGYKGVDGFTLKVTWQKASADVVFSVGVIDPMSPDAAELQKRANDAAWKGYAKDQQKAKAAARAAEAARAKQQLYYEQQRQAYERAAQAARARQQLYYQQQQRQAYERAAQAARARQYYYYQQQQRQAYERAHQAARSRQHYYYPQRGYSGGGYSGHHSGGVIMDAPR